MIVTYLTPLIPGCVGVSDLGTRYEVLFADGTTRDATAAEVLEASKAARIAAINDKVRERLVKHYGDALEQVSRATGLYGATAQANHAAGVEATIDASNVARDAINAATTIAAVEAVTVQWPTLT